MRKILIALSVLLSLVLIPVSWLMLTESGLRWALDSALGLAPGNLQIGEIEGRLAGPIILRNIHYNVQDNDIHVERLELEWRPLELLAGRIHVQRLHTETLTINLPLLTEAPKQDEAPFVLPDIHLPLVVVVDDLQLNKLQLQRGDENLLVLQRAKLDARAGPLQARLNTLEIDGENFGVGIQGKLNPHGAYRHQLAIDWHYQPPDTSPIRGRGVMQGDINSTRLEQTLSGLLDAKLSVSLNNALTESHWQANINLIRFDAQKANPAWPLLDASLKMQAEGNFSTATSKGNFKIRYPLTGPMDGDFQLHLRENQTLEVERLAIRNPNNLLVVLNGIWEPGEGFGQSNLALRWENLTWPLSGTPQVASDRGALQLSGNPNAYEVSLAANINNSTVPESFLRATGQGDLSHFNLQWLQIDTLDGHSNGSGRITWQPKIEWQAELKGDELNPAVQWPQLPGRLKFEMTSIGRIVESGVVADVNLKDLSGALYDQSLKAHSLVGIQGNTIAVETLNVQAGTSTFTARGSVGETFNLNWQLRAPNLSELLPEGRGALNADGRLKGTIQSPNILFNLTGDDLAFQQHSLNSIKTKLHLDLQGNQELQLNLEANGIKTAGQQIDKLNTTLSGTLSDHQFNLNMISPRGQLVIGLNGSLQEKNWTGQLTKAGVQETKAGNWQLEKMGVIHVVQFNSLKTDRLCWNSNDSQLCLQINYTPDRIQIQTQGRKLQLALLEFALPEDLEIDGSVDLDAKGRWQTGQAPEVDARVELSGGSISYPLLKGERQHWDYRGGTLNAQLDKQGVNSQLQIKMQKNDQLNARLNLPDFNPLQFDLDQQPIKADVRLIFGNLEMLEILFPEVHSVKGDMNLAFNVDGTLRRPKLKGQATLRNGGAAVPQLGLELKEITFIAQSRRGESLVFNAEISSGDGKLKVKGTSQLSAEEGWPTTINITGKEVLVSQTPQARVYISPDINIRIKGREIRVNGIVRVPIARIEPKDVANAVTVSDDVIIVGLNQQEEEKWRIYSDVRVILGDRVRYRGQGFEGRIEGNIVVRDEPGQLTTASGELTIPEGRYEAYGQRLQVQDGRILFTGGPITNPGLDIRAVRIVSDVTAGIRVQGTLNSPQLELFSIPPMGQSDALAYLLLGRPLTGASSQEDSALVAQAALALSLKGGDVLARSIGDRFGLEEMRIEAGGSGDEASLIIGRYLSPRIYISYGVGLIQAVNTATLTYEISRRWQFRAEAGEQQGGDFIYTIEKGD